MQSTPSHQPGWAPQHCRQSACANLILLLMPALVFAQAGPPLITNDPDTPGPGHWEINVAATGSNSREGSDVAAPDIDINYGWGERIQLSVHAPWVHARSTGGAWASGLGAIEFAMRWRFVDQEAAGFAMAIQPHWASSWSSAAVRRGLAPAGDEFALPLQVAKTFGKTTAGLEVGRNLVGDAPDEWPVGLFVARDCTPHLECLAEINAVRPDGGHAQTVFNVGMRHPLGEHVVLIGSLGRQIDGIPGEARATTFYLGVQLLRWRGQLFVQARAAIIAA